jgi:hypothetical protein
VGCGSSFVPYGVGSLLEPPGNYAVLVRCALGSSEVFSPQRDRRSYCAREPVAQVPPYVPPATHRETDSVGPNSQ